jgi:hypothetical protein
MRVSLLNRTCNFAPFAGPGVPGAPAFGALGWQSVEAG